MLVTERYRVCLHTDAQWNLVLAPADIERALGLAPGDLNDPE